MAEDQNNGLALKSRDGYTGKLFLPSTADIATLNTAQNSISTIDPTARFIVSSTEPETADDGKIWIDLAPTSSPYPSDITYTTPTVYLTEITNDYSGLLYQATITPYSQSTYKPVNITLKASVNIQLQYLSHTSGYSAGIFSASFTSSPVFFMIKFTDYQGAAYTGVSPSTLSPTTLKAYQPSTGYLNISYNANKDATYLVPSAGTAWTICGAGSGSMLAVFLGDLSCTYTVGANGGGMSIGTVSISSDYSPVSNRYVTTAAGEMRVHIDIDDPTVTWSTD